MRNVLADLAIESEAATVLAMRLARAYDEGDDTFKRLATAVAKYWVCKRAPEHAYEALETQGGNGYVEDSGMPRLYREAPLASIWEGSGNVMALDVLRALAKEPATLAAFFDEVDARRRRQRAPRRARRRACARSSPTSTRSRCAPAASSSTWRSRCRARCSSATRRAAVADAFCAARLGGDAGHDYGTLPAGTDFAAIVARHTPAA